MNKNYIEKTENGYFLVCKDGQRMVCKTWFEKAKDRWHVVLPKNNPTGRTYITKALVDATGKFEFDDRVEPPRQLGNNGWQSRLTEEEKEELEQLNARIAEIKEIAMSRPVKELTEEEKTERQIAALQRKLAALRGNV